MSGHNKWSKIKRTKGAADVKRNKLYTKLLREIQVSARMGGGADPKTNPRLRDAISEAKANNMPKDNIERAIKRGTGELEGSNYEEIIYEGYGPGGVALLIESMTDNRNRTVAELRFLMTKQGGALGESGSVAWMFQKKGLIVIQKQSGNQTYSEEQMTEYVLESEAEDLSDGEDAWEVVTSIEKFNQVKSFFESHQISWVTAELTYIPKNTVELSEEVAQSVMELIEAVEELDDVQKVHANF